MPDGTLPVDGLEPEGNAVLTSKLGTTLILRRSIEDLAATACDMWSGAYDAPGDERFDQGFAASSLVEAVANLRRPADVVAFADRLQAKGQSHLAGLVWQTAVASRPLDGLVELVTLFAAAEYRGDLRAEEMVREIVRRRPPRAIAELLDRLDDGRLADSVVDVIVDTRHVHDTVHTVIAFRGVRRRELAVQLTESLARELGAADLVEFTLSLEAHHDTDGSTTALWAALRRVRDRAEDLSFVVDLVDVLREHRAVRHAEAVVDYVADGADGPPGEFDDARTLKLTALLERRELTGYASRLLERTIAHRWNGGRLLDALNDARFGAPPGERSEDVGLVLRTAVRHVDPARAAVVAHWAERFDMNGADLVFPTMIELWPLRDLVEAANELAGYWPVARRLLHEIPRAEEGDGDDVAALVIAFRDHGNARDVKAGDALIRQVAERRSPEQVMALIRGLWEGGKYRPEGLRATVEKEVGKKFDVEEFLALPGAGESRQVPAAAQILMVAMGNAGIFTAADVVRGARALREAGSIRIHQERIFEYVGLQRTLDALDVAGLLRRDGFAAQADAVARGSRRRRNWTPDLLEDD